MPGTVPRFNPAGGPRQSYSVRGVVMAHSICKVGWWPFKQKVAILQINLDQAQVREFNQIARQSMGTLGERNLKGITDVITLGMPNERIVNYPVGTTVGITFGYAGPLLQFYQAAEPLTVTDIQVITGEKVLENEVQITTQ